MEIVNKAGETNFHRNVALKFLPPDLKRDEVSKSSEFKIFEIDKPLKNHNLKN